MKRFWKVVYHGLEEYLMIFLTIVLTLVIFLQVIFRYLVGAPLYWPEEMARYCFVFCTFLSLGYCMKNNVSLKVDLLVNKLPQKQQKYVEIARLVLTMLLYGYFCYYSVEFVQNAIESGQTTAALELPVYLLYMIVPVGFALGIIRGIIRLILCIQDKLQDEIHGALDL